MNGTKKLLDLSPKKWENTKMDTQLNNYQVLKNGESMGVVGTLEEMVRYVRLLEQGINRHLYGSPYTPYTIGKKNGS